MSSLKGTQTEQNLLKAFAGESQARNRYTYAAKVAGQEGLHQIAEIFTETAENERVHAKTFFKFLEGGVVQITASYPAGVIGTTAGNLRAAAEGEHEEWVDLYPQFAEIALAEGFPRVAAAFKAIARAEQAHEDRFRALLARVEAGTLYERGDKVTWKCRKCGFRHDGTKPPAKCPACGHESNYFEVVADTF
jgi:rubrerythrin